MTIDDIPRKINKDSKVYNIVTFIINNINILKVISIISSDIDIEKQKKGKCDISKIIDNCLEDFILSGEISYKVALRFKSLWMNTTNESKGTVLEEIIANCGPYKCKFNLLGYSRNCKVYETKKDNNFDVIFYDKELAKNVKDEQRVEISGNIEFHECKKNINNYIPCDPKKIDEKVKAKLDFIKNVHELTNTGYFYIPTFKYNTVGAEQYLKENGYDFIKVIGIKKIMMKYCTSI